MVSSLRFQLPSLFFLFSLFFISHVNWTTYIFAVLRLFSFVFCSTVCRSTWITCVLFFFISLAAAPNVMIDSERTNATQLEKTEPKSNKRIFAVRSLGNKSGARTYFAYCMSADAVRVFLLVRFRSRVSRYSKTGFACVCAYGWFGNCAIYHTLVQWPCYTRMSDKYMQMHALQFCANKYFRMCSALA